VKESRPAVAAEHPGAAPAEVMKLLGAAWRGLPEAGRAGFVERARALKAEEGAGREGGAGGGPKSKRAANAYVHFCTSERRAFAAEHPGMAPPDVMRELGRRWRALDDAAKAEWKAKAAAAAAEGA